MSKVHECASELIPFIDAAIRADFKTARKVHETIEDLEHAADNIKRQLRLNLPKTIFMPVARADLLDLITAQDRIANRSKDISGLILGRQLPFPEVTRDLFQAFTARAVDASAQACKTVGELGELFESGFRGTEVQVMEEMIATLDEIESDTDRIEVEVRDKLYTIEKEYSPIDVMFMYKTIDDIGELANLAQTVGARLQLILAR